VPAWIAGTARDAPFQIWVGYPTEAQNAQWCTVAKSVSPWGRGGTSEIICWLWLPKPGHGGWPTEEGKPCAAKLVQ
jgi:hypothetical protein